jgi:hypothetical protein
MPQTRSATSETPLIWRVIIEDDDLRIPAISLEDLKRNKLASGRKKDLLDLDELP